MKQVIILGSEGFIGSNLVQHFVSRGYETAGCDLYEGIVRGYTYFKVSRLSPEWDEVFSGKQYDYCINAAGSGNVPYSMTHPFIDFESNTLDTLRVLDAIRRFNPGCRYIHISSAAVYGNPDKLPVTEDAPKQPLSPYGWHKLMAEQICGEYSTVYGLATAIVRPFSVYGPGLKKQIFWDVFQKIKTNPSAIELWGTGGETRDFVYITDLANCIEIVARQASMKGEVYNIASGTETKIKEAVEIFISCLQTATIPTFNNHVREGDPLQWRADITKVKNMGFVAETTLAKGLMQFSGWLKTIITAL